MLKSRGRVTLAAQVQARQGIVRGALKSVRTLVEILLIILLNEATLERIQFTPVHILRRRNNFGIPWG